MSDQFLISIQTQPCPVSCVATCFAMVAGIPASIMAEKFHARYRNDEISIGDILRELEIPFSDYPSSDRNSFRDEGVYLVSVPSLNIRGGMHQIVIEMTSEGLWSVFDPNYDRCDRLFYVASDDEVREPAVRFSGGYSIDAKIDRQALAIWRKNKAR